RARRRRPRGRARRRGRRSVAGPRGPRRGTAGPNRRFPFAARPGRCGAARQRPARGPRPFARSQPPGVALAVGAVSRLVVAVVGPTATGKSDLSLDLAQSLDAEIVNADAFQLYRGMDVGTAKL